MNNQNKILLAPLLEENKTQEAIQVIESGNFNIYELSEKGNNLFTLAFYYEEFTIAEKLLNFNTNVHQKFSLEIDNFISLYLFEKAIVKPENFFQMIEKYKAFINNHNIVLNLDFYEALDAMDYYGEDSISLFKKVDNINLLKFLLKDSIKDIKQLNPIDTIKIISKLKSPNLLAMYYEICEFDTLPIQEHPSFKLLKDVVTHPTKYYDFYVFSQDPDRENLEYNIEENSILKIKNEFDKINRAKDFSKYFKKGKSFLPDIFKLHRIPYFDRTLPIPAIEVNRIHSAIHNLNENVLVENQEKFLNYYLINWPIHYFPGKSKNHENLINEDQVFQLKQILSKYSISNIVIHKDKDIEETIKIIKESANEIKFQFNLEDHEVGNHDLSIIFYHINQNQESMLAYFYDKNKSISFCNNLSYKDNVSIFIHEYTHYLQFQDEILMKKLEELGKLSKEWISYAQKDFAENLFNYIAVDYYENILHSKKVDWLSLIEYSIEKCHDGETLFNFIKKESSHLFTSEDYNCFKQYNFEHAIIITDIYYQTQKNKDYSYEYYLWENLEKNRILPSKHKKKSDSIYWNAPLEIHARLNEDLYEERTNETYTSINPAKLKQMKSMIQNFNEMFVSRIRENKLKL